LNFFALGRDHRKLIVQDRVRLVAGGMCLADLWLGHCVSRCTWRDSAILAEGECAAAAAKNFDQLWGYGVPLTLRPKPGVAYSRSENIGHFGNVPVRVVADLKRNRATEQVLVRVVRAAQSEILITNQYCLPTPAVRHELVEAVRRGVSVKMIVPRLGRPLIAGLATEHELGRLLAGGGNSSMALGDGPMAHAKTVAVDRIWSLIGSSNLDAQSLRFNAELNIEVHGSAIGEQMAEVFAHDVLGSTAFSLENWHARRRTRRLLTRVTHFAAPIL
jgi:cardiolipin synthase